MNTIKGQAFIVSLYAAGRRIASDCIPYFLPTRSAAHEAGRAWVESSQRGEWKGDPDLGWAVRYTVRRITINE